MQRAGNALALCRFRDESLAESLRKRMAMHGWRRLAAVFSALLALACIGLADSAVIHLSNFPSLSIADGRSTVTVTAAISDRSGRLVPDGTQVVFTTNLGNFREPVVQTSKGVARAILVAGSIPGIAKITATAISFSATATLDVEFVGDREQLSTAKEYVEVVSPKYLMYSVEDKLLAAAGPDKGVSLRYREIEVEADDLQFSVPTYEVRARKARLTLGGKTTQFDELYLKLNQRKGYGTTTADALTVIVVPAGKFFVDIVRMQPRYTVFEVGPSGLKTPSQPVNPTVFEFESLENAPVLVSAKKAVVFPRREVQFHDVEIYSGGARVMKLPLFQASIYGQTPILTEQIVNVYDNQLSVNYPYYLSLKPGQTSLMRFRYGTHYSRSSTTSNAALLDYELNWNRGDDMEGGLTVSGIGRNDWGLGLRQYYRINDSTAFNAQLEFPAHESVFGAASFSKQFSGYHAALSASSTRTLRGQPYQSQQLSFVIESEPVKLGILPMRMYYGLTASQSATKTNFYDRSQTAAGVQTRMLTNPIRLDKASTLNASVVVKKLQGENTLEGLTTLADVSLSRRFGSRASAVLTYNFADDGYTSSFLGRNSLSLQSYFDLGRTRFTGYASRSLDIDRANYMLDGSYRLNSFWRISYTSTFNQYFAESYLDDYWALSYRLGGRDIGIVWSGRTKRLGLQLLGATID